MTLSIDEKKAIINYRMQKAEDKGFTARTHSGVIHLIGFEFVSKGYLSKEDGRLISRLFNMRQSGDYDDLFDWTEEEVTPFFEKTTRLLSNMRGLITLL